MAGIFLAALLAAFVVYPPLWNRPAEAMRGRIEFTGTYLTARTGVEEFTTISKKISPERFRARFLGRDLTNYALGLDLVGGAHLEYVAEVSELKSRDVDDAIAALRDTIERRVNIFGVREPRVESVKSGDEHRLIVEIAGVTDVGAAIARVGDPVFLEFREERPGGAFPITGPTGEPLEIDPQLLQDPNFRFQATDLTGQYLKRADVVFDPTTNQPQVQLTFNEEGAEIFQELTKQNIGKQIAIFLDGIPVTAPVVQQEIVGGQAVVTGSFTIEGAKELVQNLNAGALPVPITLVAQRTVGATLGARSLQNMLKASLATAILIVLFMLLIYRLPGLLAVISLTLYGVFMLALFKLVPVTMTLAGVAGFILSVGMAVDANILIFARMREERHAGRTPVAIVEEGFKRAWTAIRDSNVSTLLTTGVLYAVGTSFVRGFALTLGIGVAVSMLTAYTATRFLLREAVRHERLTKTRFIW